MTANATAAKLTIITRCPSCATMNRVDLSLIANGPRCSKCGVALALDKPQPVSDADFRKIINGASVPVVVDFYADWCGPCRAMAPAFAEFASKEAGRVLTLKLDTDANPHTATEFGIRGIPTIIAFRDGRELRRHVGMADARVLEGLIA